MSNYRPHSAHTSRDDRSLSPVKAVVDVRAPFLLQPIDDRVDFARYGGAIWQHRWRIVCVAVFFGLLGGAVARFSTPIFRAQATFEVIDPSEAIKRLRDLDTNAPVRDTTAYMATQLQMVQTAALADRVGDKLNLAKQFSEPKGKPGLRERLAVWLRLSPAQSPTPKESVRSLILGSLDVESVRDSHLVHVSYESPDPQMATAIVNETIREFSHFRRDIQFEALKRTNEWVSNELEGAKQKLRSSEEQLQAYAQKSNLLFTNETDSVAEQRLKQIQEELSRAQAELLAKQSQYEQTLSTPPEALPDIIADPTLKQYRVQITDLRRQLADMQTLFTPNHYKVSRLNAQLSELTEALARERQVIVNALKTEYEAKKRREKLLMDAYDRQLQLIGASSKASVQYSVLKREVEANRLLYESLLQRSKELNLSTSLQSNDLRVIDWADVPRVPVKPNVPVSLALGTVSGLLLGVAGVVGRDVWERHRAKTDNTIRRPGQITIELQVPEIGVIPSIALENRLADAKSAPGASRLLAAGDPGERPPGLYDLTHTGAQSIKSEFYRNVLPTLILNSRPGARVIAITSPSPGEGKTTTAANLAERLGRLRQRVLLIDADLRRPQIHKAFNIPCGPGLVDLLEGSQPFDKAMLSSFTSVIDGSQITVMPRGSRSSARPELLASDRFRELLSWSRENYGFTIVDTPPFLNLFDSQMICSTVDGVLLVFRAGITNSEDATTVVRWLQQHGSPVLGTILNDYDPGKDEDVRFNSYYRYLVHDAGPGDSNDTVRNVNG